MDHWHAYAYTGPTKPEDRDARDPLSATPPLVVREWLRKPRGMLVGTFTEPEAALTWLAAQLAESPPPPSAVPADTVIGYARERIARHPYDQVTRYYTAGSYVCRDLVRCTGAPGECPAPA
ncbi:hypothetical protein [Streptomyces sp.]|uniref:hypothetical protein n=1 Tax=Streptomyces sp. TaxID=1931 RepID=UPI002F42E779